jgi:predicted nicotinamide N-methyase
MVSKPPLRSEFTTIQQRSHVTYSFPMLDQVGAAATITLSETKLIYAAYASTGFRTWEASIFLAKFLATEGRSYIQGQRVLEIGAGTGLVSVLCTKFLGAAYVKATDGSSDIVCAMGDTLYRNDVDDHSRIDAMVLPWGLDPGYTADYCIRDAFDIMLGADIVRFQPMANLKSPVFHFAHAHSHTRPTTRCSSKI